MSEHPAPLSMPSHLSADGWALHQSQATQAHSVDGDNYTYDVPAPEALHPLSDIAALRGDMAALRLEYESLREANHYQTTRIDELERRLDQMATRRGSTP